MMINFLILLFSFFVKDLVCMEAVVQQLVITKDMQAEFTYINRSGKEKVLGDHAFKVVNNTLHKKLELLFPSLKSRGYEVISEKEFKERELKLQQMTQQINELKSKLYTCDAANFNDSKMKKELEAQLRLAELQVLQEKQSILEFQSKLVTLKEANLQLENEKKQLENSQKNLNAQLESVIKNRNTLSESIETLGNNQMQAKTKHEELTARMQKQEEVAEEKLKRKELELTSLKEEMKSLETQQSSIQQQLDETSKSLETKSQELLENTKKFESLHRGLGDLADKLGVILEDQDSLDKRLGMVAEEAVKLKTTVDNQSKRFGSVAQQLPLVVEDAQPKAVFNFTATDVVTPKVPLTFGKVVNACNENQKTGAKDIDRKELELPRVLPINNNSIDALRTERNQLFNAQSGFLRQIEALKKLVGKKRLDVFERLEKNQEALKFIQGQIKDLEGGQEPDEYLSMSTDYDPLEDHDARIIDTTFDSGKEKIDKGRVHYQVNFTDLNFATNEKLKGLRVQGEALSDSIDKDQRLLDKTSEEYLQEKKTYWFDEYVKTNGALSRLQEKYNKVSQTVVDQKKLDEILQEKQKLVDENNKLEETKKDFVKGFKRIAVVATIGSLIAAAIACQAPIKSGLLKLWQLIKKSSPSFSAKKLVPDTSHSGTSFGNIGHWLTLKFALLRTRAGW